MLQRVQTIYLFLATLFFALSLFLPILSLENSSYSFWNIPIEWQNQLPIKYSLTICSALIGICTILVLYAIFQFKKRKLQMRLIMYVFIVNLLTIALIGFSVFSLIDSVENLKISYGLLGLPINLILLPLGRNKIAKDEKLIRSLDRIR